MKITIKFYQPYNNIINKSEIDIVTEKDNLNLSELIKLIIEKEPKLKEYLLSDNNEEMFRKFIVIRDNEMLRFDSCINNNDTLKILSPLHGG